MNRYKIMRQLLIKSLLLMIAVTTMVNMGNAEENQESELSGADLWAQNCGRCHNYR